FFYFLFLFFMYFFFLFFFNKFCAFFFVGVGGGFVMLVWKNNESKILNLKIKNIYIIELFFKKK
ncbi:hypothetical protein ACSTG6_23465, partial [Vibrio parahaemolyticus]